MNRLLFALMSSVLVAASLNGCGGGGEIRGETKDAAQTSDQYQKRAAQVQRTGEVDDVVEYSYRGKPFVGAQPCTSGIDGRICGPIVGKISFRKSDLQKYGGNAYLLTASLSVPAFRISYPGNAVVAGLATVSVNAVGEIVGWYIVIGSPDGQFAITTSGGTSNPIQNFDAASMPDPNGHGKLTEISFTPGMWSKVSEHSPASTMLTLIDPSPRLMLGAQITPCFPNSSRSECKSSGSYIPPLLSDLERGRVVKGVAADGAAQVVLGIAATRIGEKFRVTLESSQCGSLSSPTCADAYGLLFDPVSTVDVFGLASSQLEPTQPAVQGPNGPMAFFAYRAPLDFVRTGHVPEDEKLASRSVKIAITSLLTNQVSWFEIEIIRPPVILIHGLGSDSSVWSDFKPFITRSDILSISRFDYGGFVVPRKYVRAGHHGNFEYDYAAVRAITPVPKPASAYYAGELSIKAAMRESSLGLAFNARHFLTFLRASILQVSPSGAPPAGRFFTEGANPAGIPVAAVAVDIVAHSMGGLISRYLPNLSDYYSSRDYFRGPVHKLITLGTPHLGSQQALRILDAANTCSRESAEKVQRGGVDLISAEIRDSLNNSVYQLVQAGTGDLRGNGLGQRADPTPLIPPSESIRSLSETIPMALVAADMGGQVENLKRITELPLAVIGLYESCGGQGGEPYAALFNGYRFSEIFDPYLGTGIENAKKNGSYFSDAIVPLTSAVNSDIGISGVSQFEVAKDIEELEKKSGAKIFRNVIHGAGTMELGFPGPHLLEESSGVPAYALQLLNTPITSDVYRVRYGRF